MKIPLHVGFVGGLLLIVCASAGAQTVRTSHIGYAFPAGGQTGTTLDVTIGGKGIANVETVHISGSGVRAEFVQHIGNYQAKLREQYRVIKQLRSGNQNQIEKSKERRFGEAPDHELFTRLEDMPIGEFRQMAEKFQKKEQVQRNREINELAVLRITINEDAKPGIRELRLQTKTGGLSNPIRFMVNTLPEAREQEPNDRAPRKEYVLEPPFVMNGQIMPGDEDRFSFQAQEGQNLVVSVKARELIPYLADAVPGWFQAVVAVYDDSDKEVAFADDFLFNPDPTLLLKVPKSGIYQLSIRDSIFRGREDFVYRISVGEIPFVTGIHPLGGQAGSTTKVTAYGWNLDAEGFMLDTRPTGPTVRKGFLHSAGTISNYVRYAVGNHPEKMESESNDGLAGAQPVDMDSVVNGQISQPGDIDYYLIDARAGESVTIETQARQLYSPVDTLLRIMDMGGNLVAWNDDIVPEGNLTDRTGLLTHNADSSLQFDPPESGSYLIQVSDTQNNGGPSYSYRLKVTKPIPDFDLYVTPSALTVTTGGGAKATLHVKRKNGFDGPIDVAFARDVQGINLTGGHIPSGCSSLPVVVTHRGKPPARLLSLNLVASASINGETVIKRVIPADDITQAFITHHLVEARNFLVHCKRFNRRHPNFRKQEAESIVFRKDQSAALHLNTGNLTYDPTGLTFEMADGPVGLEMQTHSGMTGTRLEFSPSDGFEPGQQGNLVVAVYYTFSPKQNNSKAQQRKLPIGELAAIPYRTE